MLVFLLAIPYPLVAGPNDKPTEDPAHLRVELTIPNAQKAATSQELKLLLHEAHENMEGEESGSFVSRWMNQFNYKRLFLNAYRWYELKRSDPKSRDHALNLVLMFAMSHTLETIGGLALASHGLQPDTNPLLGAIFGILGVGITIPGLDPLCLGLMALYWRAPVAMDAALTVPRVVIFKSTGFLARTLGISAVMRWMWENQEAKAWLVDKIDHAPAGTYVFEQTVDSYDYSFPSVDGASSLKLSLIEKGEGTLALNRLHLSDLNLNSKILPAWLPLFGSNIKDAVQETVSLLKTGKEEELRKKNYIQGLTREWDGTMVVDFKSDALRLYPQRTLRLWNAAKSKINACLHWIARPK